MSISHLQNDTSEQSGLIQHTQLSCLKTLATQAPFDGLVTRLQQSTTADFENACLGHKVLNELSAYWSCQDKVPAFVGDEKYMNDQRFYEQIIHQDFKVPTRRNWHDFFNGLVWLQFPKTKAYFTQKHNQEILQFGLKNRSAVRDRITHFDECGLFILTNDPSLEQDIREHCWHDVFVKRRAQWHHVIRPFIIGHALWEMLLDPFIGLTAKVKVCYIEDFSSLKLSPLVSFDNGDTDSRLLQTLQNEDCFNKPRPWLPLPLLGIPNWSTFEQNATFYANKNYFMPKRARS